MIGIVIITHGELASGLKSAANLLLGETGQLAYAELRLGDNPLDFKSKVDAVIDEVDSGDGILVLVDLFGGTPSNTVSQLFERDDIRALAGVNLPMLVEAIFSRENSDIDELANRVMQAGSESLIDVRQKFIDAAAAEDDEDF